MSAEDQELIPVSDSQPATQPLDDVEGFKNNDDLSEDEAPSQPKPYGFLYPLSYKFKVVELVNDSTTVGRSTQNDHVIFPEQTPKEVNDRISKFQFIIERKENQGIKLTDRSSNGTWVRGNLIGKGKSVMLVDKNVISIGNVNAWVVSVNDPMYQRAYPREVRKEVTVSYLLGTGAMGEVFLAFRKRDDKRMALKSLKEEHLDNPKNRESFMNEVGFFKTLKHPNIIRMYSFIETENHGLFIGLEYADKGDLFHLVKDRKGLDESTARYLYFQALKALEYLHEKDIAHRDIKLENFLLVST